MFRFGAPAQDNALPGPERSDLDRGRFDELEPIAVVDIGSNSVRLVVYEGAVRAPTPLFNEKVLCGLGRTVSSKGVLDPDGVRQAIDALRRFRALIRTLKAKNVHVIATAAARDAANGPDFIARAEEAIGAPVVVLSGEREAELAAYGVRMGFHDPDGVAADLGGGSLELIDVCGGELSNAATLPLGGLRLIDESKGQLDEAEKIIARELRAISWHRQAARRTFYAVGGTWRSLAKLHMANSGYPLRVMHQYEVGTKELIEFCREVRRPRKGNGLKGFEAVSKQRRDTLPFGALVLEMVLSRLRPKSVVFSVFGIREGLLYEFLPESERQGDPLISFCEDYARLRSRSMRHAYELVQWTDALFTGHGLAETTEQRRLRAAACLLSDIGWRAHPDYRGEQSLNVVAHAALAGIDHPGRLFLALSVYFRHAGPGETGGEGLASSLKGLVSEDALLRARIIAAAVRTAHMLSAGMAGVIDETPLRVEPDKIVLQLARAHAQLEGERLRRRFKALGDLMRRQTVIELTE